MGYFPYSQPLTDRLTSKHVSFHVFNFYAAQINLNFFHAGNVLVAMQGSGWLLRVVVVSSEFHM